MGIILHYVKSLLYVSISPHDLSSFTSLPVWDFKSWQVSFSNEQWMMAIIFIINKIYQKRKLQKIYSKTIIKRFLYKLITEVSFWFNYQLVKQTDDSTICFILENINMIRMEIGTVARTIFWNRFVNYIYTYPQATSDKLYNVLTNYHLIKKTPQRLLNI